MPLLDPSAFLRVTRLNGALESHATDPARRAALDAVLARTADHLDRGARDVLASLPATIADAMRPFGWAWNGFYAPRGPAETADDLHLSFAHGPPVCSPLVRSGGPLTSGMCFDALHLNQTLAAFDAKSWPGYVSCDAASGLGTVAGIVAPVRDPAGAPIAVWDLDATRPIEPCDVRVMDVLFATLARCVELRPEDFGLPTAPWSP
ncbi:MAG: hypothetical protein AAGB93_21995 [Planctomycetota bacterium]